MDAAMTEWTYGLVCWIVKTKVLVLFPVLDNVTTTYFLRFPCSGFCDGEHYRASIQLVMSEEDHPILFADN